MAIPCWARYQRYWNTGNCVFKTTNNKKKFLEENLLPLVHSQKPDIAAGWAGVVSGYIPSTCLLCCDRDHMKSNLLKYVTHVQAFPALGKSKWYDYSLCDLKYMNRLGDFCCAACISRSMCNNFTKKSKVVSRMKFSYPGITTDQKDYIEEGGFLFNDTYF